VATQGIKTGKTAICMRHKREYPIDRFYTTRANEEFLPDKVIPYCSECMEEMVKYYYSKTQSLESAIYYTCAKVDIPFIKEVCDRAVSKFNHSQAIRKDKDKSNLFAIYYDFLWGDSSLEKQTDMWYDFSDSDTAYEDLVGDPREAEIKNHAEEIKEHWGVQDSYSDYKFLIDLYNKYTAGIRIENPQQEDLYRDLCLARLEKRKLEAGKEGDITKIQNRIFSLMNKLKIDNFADTTPKTLSEQLIFEKIAQIEQHEPAEFYKEPKKWKDFNKLRQYQKDMVLRPTLNTLANLRDFNIDIDDIEKYNLRDD